MPDGKRVSFEFSDRVQEERIKKRNFCNITDNKADFNSFLKAFDFMWTSHRVFIADDGKISEQ